MIEKLREGRSTRACVCMAVRLYDKIEERLKGGEKELFRAARAAAGLLYAETACKEEVEKFDPQAAPLYRRLFMHARGGARGAARYVDYNQGLDARLVTEEKMKKLAETNIRPLRIAFDHYEQRDVYEKAVRMAAKYGIKHMSNYLLYNFEDKPEDLYYRLKLNVELCDELKAAIYSFPMKYPPITDPLYFGNRDYLGPHWNRKFVRAVQAVLNATKGTIGQGKSFFEWAFGADIDAFFEILWMPEAFIIYRQKSCRLAEEWRRTFHSLTKEESRIATDAIARCRLPDNINNKAVEKLLAYYRITRRDILSGNIFSCGNEEA